MRVRSWRRLVILVAALGAVSACGGGGASVGSGPAASERSEPPATSVAPAGEREPAPDLPPSGEPSPGCGAAPDVEPVGDERPGDVEQRFATPSGERVYRLAVPRGYDREAPIPLVLNLHGSGSNAEQATAYGDVARRGAARGMLVAAPEGRSGRWELPGEGDDHEFLVSLVADLGARYCVDLERVHIVGMSLGAWKAAMTACTRPDLFASISLVTVEVFPGTCEPMPVIAFHGTADNVAAYGPGGSAPDPDGPNPGISGTLANMDRWAANGRCAPEAELTSIGDDVVEHRFPGCAPGVDVVLMSIEGGGHTWPGSDIELGSEGGTTQTISATDLTLDFFEAHPRPPR